MLLNVMYNSISNLIPDWKCLFVFSQQVKCLFLILLRKHDNQLFCNTFELIQAIKLNLEAIFLL